MNLQDDLTFWVGVSAGAFIMGGMALGLYLLVLG